MMDFLRITEIFHSLQGESTTVGIPTVFIRLTGCPLRCQYCDTVYSFRGGKKMTQEDIISQVNAYQCPYVCVTGGEPLAQPGSLALLRRLCDDGFYVSLETSGALSLENIDPRVIIVMDLKTPDSGEQEKNKLTNLELLKPADQIKFVICSRRDYEWANEMIQKYDLTKRSQILFSPSWGQMNPTLLAEWILNDKLPVRFQLQLHKILWHDEPGH